MTLEEQAQWRELFQVHGIIGGEGFPESIELLPTGLTTFSFLSVITSTINPFLHEYAALQFALVLVRVIQNRRGPIFPARIKITAQNWRSLCSDRFPISEGAIQIEIHTGPESDVRFAIPKWIEKRHTWKYQLGQILRVLLTGITDF